MSGSIFDQINSLRAQQGLPPLSPDTGRVFVASAPQEATAPLRPPLSSSARYQQQLDSNRISNAVTRQAGRDEIAVAEFDAELATRDQYWEAIEALYRSRNRPEALRYRGGSILAQVTDVHFGGTVRGLEARKDANTYGLEIAAHRLAVYAEKIIHQGAFRGAEELVIALTGDIFDSKIGKNRLDKILHSEGSAASVYASGRDLIFQFIDTLIESEVFGRVRVHGVAGNEARLYAERGHGHLSASDNWDALLNADLVARYRGSDVELEFGVNRYVAIVQGWKVLLIHGDQALDSNLTQSKTQSLLGAHSADFGISGHVHDTRLTGKWARSASVIGTDCYAGDGLGLEGRASQNIHWLSTSDQKEVTVIDLQTPDPSVEPFKLYGFQGSFGAAENL